MRQLAHGMHGNSKEKAVVAGEYVRICLISAHMFNLPVRRRVIGAVAINCKPGPDPVLSKDEESELVEYCCKNS